MTFQLGTPQTWIAVAACAAWYILLYVIIACCFPVIPTITLDIIEHQCHTKDVKETVRNVWTNIALVAALILTISTSIVIADKPEADFAAADAFATVCVCFAGLSTLQFVQVVLECVVHLIYTEPLDPAGVMRYLIANNGAIGGPAFSTVLASFHFCLAMLVWIALNYGLPALVFLGIIFAVMIVITVDTVRKAMAFSPNRDTKGSGAWSWADKSEANSKIPFVQHKLGAKAIAILRRRAADAAAYESGASRAMGASL